MRKSKLNLYEWFLGAIGVAFVFAFCAGWILNIFAICEPGFEWTGFMVVRCIGVLMFPLGCVLGWL